MMRMLKKIAGWSWKKKIIVIICVVLTLVLGAAGAVFGYAASKVNKIQKIEVKKERNGLSACAREKQDKTCI